MPEPTIMPFIVRIVGTGEANATQPGRTAIEEEIYYGSLRHRIKREVLLCCFQYCNSGT
eukprot:COSAG02_NODE_899_length_16096_cov_19.762956_4_plen_59_part_00